MRKVLLDVTLLNPLLIQILDELLPLHPVDEWTDVTAVSEEGSARQVDRTSCGDEERQDGKCRTTFLHWKTHWEQVTFYTTGALEPCILVLKKWQATLKQLLFPQMWLYKGNTQQHPLIHPLFSVLANTPGSSSAMTAHVNASMHISPLEKLLFYHICSCTSTPTVSIVVCCKHQLASVNDATRCDVLPFAPIFDGTWPKSTNLKTCNI